MTDAEVLIAALTVLAILVGPFLGVFAQKLLDDLRSKKNRRKDIFQVLMATRQARVSPEHVHALNRIDIEFRGVGDVEKAWHEYRDHLNYPGPLQNLNQADQAAWHAKGNELFTNLLFAMSTSLGLGFERQHLSSSAYRPQAYFWEDEFQQGLRWAVVQLLTGKLALPIRVVGGAPQADQPAGPPPTGAAGPEGPSDPGT